VIRTQPLFGSALDFVGLHLHPGVELTLPQYMQNYELTTPVVKPVVIDDFGAFQYVYPTAGDGNLALLGVEADSCVYGIDGWLFWSWDTTEFAAGDDPLWNGTSSGSAMVRGSARDCARIPAQPLRAPATSRFTSRRPRPPPTTGAWTNVRHVRVETHASPSWVSWKEIEVYGP
jgi:hypothetical protein